MTVRIDGNVCDSYDGCMATQLTPEEAIERARRLQEDRINAVRTVAEARQRLVDVQEETARELADLQARIAERIADAERDDLRAYSAAQSAGWSVEELRKIGLSEPAKKARVQHASRPRRSRRPRLSRRRPRRTPPPADSRT